MRRSAFLVLLATFCLTGCGGGGEAPPPSSIVARGVLTARPYAVSVAPFYGDAAASRVEVSWTPTVFPGELIEYQVYRNGALIAVRPRSQTIYTDGVTPVGSDPITVHRAGSNGELLTETVEYTPLAPGEPQNYLVRALHRNPAPEGYVEHIVARSSSPVTPLIRPAVVGPTEGQDLRSVKVPFKTVPGADEYILEFSSRDNFETKVTRGPFTFPAVADTVEPPAFNLSTDFAGLPDGRMIYVRVGARNSGDSVKPYPRGTPNGGEYIYSRLNLTFPKLAQTP